MILSRRKWPVILELTLDSGWLQLALHLRHRIHHHSQRRRGLLAWLVWTLARQSPFNPRQEAGRAPGGSQEDRKRIAGGLQNEPLGCSPHTDDLPAHSFLDGRLIIHP